MTKIPGTKMSGRRKSALGAAFGLLVLAQMSGSGSYNPGTPQVPGTRVPESSPATTVSPPATSGGGATIGSGTDAGSNGAAPATGATGGPGYSFGAAPAPITSPGR